MRKFIFATILLFLALGQVWARTYSGGEILYVRNYRPSEWGSGTENWKQSGGEFWATFDDSETQVKPSRLEPTGDWNNAGTVYCFVVPDGEHTTVTLHRGNDYSGSSWSGKTSAITLDATKNYIYDGYNTDASTANWQDLPMFSNGSTMYLIRGWNWKQSNERYAAYFFDGVNSEWVDLTNHSGDIFKCTIPTRKWAYMIMCRMNGSQSANNWDNMWMQTQNIAPSGTGNCVYITGDDPNDKTATSKWRLGKYAATPAIAGGMNDWSPVANQFSEGSLTMDLAAGQAYSFKVASGEDNSWYGRNASYDNDLVYVGQTTAETLYSGQHNMMLMTAEAGTYTFELDNSGVDPTLKITYPSAGNHPSANYYYIAKNASSTLGWNSGNYIYLNFWNGSGSLATWNTDEPRLEYATEINGENYYYVPVLADYTSFKAHENKDGSSGYATGDQSLADHSGQYLDCVESSWGWHDFSYNVEEHNNGGRIWSDSIGSYTFGVGATLPTNITKWEYDFAGWYDNAELKGEPVTAISTTDNGDKEFWAKWTSIAQTYPIAEHPEFLAAQAGDIIAITVTGVHTSAAIYLKDANYTDIANLSISATGTYTFQLDADAATGIRTYGLQVTGQNFTFSDVDILYRKEIWSGTLSDNTGWADVAVDKSIFSGLSSGDFLGFNVTKLGDGESYHTYAMRADYVQQLSGSCTATGIAIKQLSAANVTAINNSKTSVDINAQYLDVSNLYSYTHTRVYSVTLNTNSGTINTGNVTAYTFGTAATLPTDVTRTGYTFAGWYPDAEFEGARVYSISTTDYGDKIYYAKWTVNVYTVEEHTNGGKINADSIGNYTFGVGATLPTNVTKWGYWFDGWYDNVELTGEPVTTISTSETGDKHYYAKWTSIDETLAIGDHPEFLAAQEGDIIVVTVSDVQQGAQIRLNETDGKRIDNKSISAIGKYAFQLSAGAADSIHSNGLKLSGLGYTKSSVTILYRRTLKAIDLDATGTCTWTSTELAPASNKTIFEDLTTNDYLGFEVTALCGEASDYHDYQVQCNYKNFMVSGKLTATGVHLQTLQAELDKAPLDSLQGDKQISVGSANLSLGNLYAYTGTRTYTVTLNTNSGTINAGDVTSYTFGTGATLPTYVTRWGYWFDGWYDNAELSGDPITTISTTDYGNKHYYAKWTSIDETLAIGDHPEFLAAQEGDIIVVTVSDVQQGAQIRLNETDGKRIDNKSISAIGKYAFQLSAGAADSIHNTGLRVTGQGYTGTVAIRYRKTLWAGTLDDTKGWTAEHIANAIFDEVEAGGYLGFNISAINDGKDWHQAGVYGGNNKSFGVSTAETGIFVDTITKADLDSLQTPAAKWVAIGAQYLKISALYYYSPRKVMVIYHDGDKADDARNTPDDSITYVGGTVYGQIEYRMKVRDLNQWYSLSLPFDVDSVCVWDTDDRKYYKIEPYYRPEVGDALIGGHYLIRTPVTATDLSLANFGDWRDPTTYDWVPSKNTPYIIQWHLEYFENMYVSFFGASGQTIPTSMTSRVAPSLDNVVNVYGNDAMVEGSVTGAYLLEGDYGSYGAWLRDEDPDASRTILPFECYIVAKSTTRARYRVLRRGMSIEETATGWEDVINSERKTCVEVYTITGYRLTQYNDCSFSETAQRLNAEYGAGMYILRAGNESVKLMLEGGK